MRGDQGVRKRHRARHRFSRHRADGAPDLLSEDESGVPAHKGIEMGTITNEIVEDSTGGLHLRFAFSLERSDMRPGRPEEKEFAAGYAQDYLVSVQKTIDAIRELVRAGRLRIRESPV